MNNSNYGFPRSGYSTPSYSTPYASSTPSNVRPNRPRFGYSGPSMYPRPRSSASKPNPDSYSDSMINNYGNSTSRIDMSFGSENGNSYDVSYKDSSDSNYYSANENPYSDSYSADSSLTRSGMGVERSNYVSPVSHNVGMYSSNSSSQYGTPSYNFNSSSFGMNNGGEQLPSQKSLFSSLGLVTRTQTFSARKFGKAKKKMTTQSTKNWRCNLCSLDFTSQIPYDMHLRGARHAKKVKAKDAMAVVQSKATVGSNGEKTFFCELCNVKANSSLQFQTHLDGNKHKNKLNPKDASQSDSKDEISKDVKNNTKTIVNASLSGKTNGSLTRPLPSDFGEPQPAKLSKFSCDICSVSMNSAIQLEQHLSSKKHQNKVEGKPNIKGKKSQAEKKESMDTEDTVTANKNSQPVGSTETAKVVVGVKTLSSSFVQGGTLQ